MPAVWLRFRAELRTRWRALLAVALLVGLAGGAALAALAGARRTDTAFGRLVEQSNAPELLVNPNNGTESRLRPHDVVSLPQVIEHGRVDGLFAVPADLESPDDLGALGVTLASDGNAGYTIDRPRLDHGRMPRR